MGGMRANRRKNWLRKHHGKGRKVSEHKKSPFKDPILKILKRMKRKFPKNDNFEKLEGQNQIAWLKSF